MKRTVSLLLAALACGVSSLAGQDEGAVFLRVPAAGTGAAVWLDSVTIVRLADSTFKATAVYQRSPDTTDRFGSDTEVDAREMDCAHARSRYRYNLPMRELRPAVSRPPEPARRDLWEPVAAADLPIFAAVCEYLLQRAFPVQTLPPADPAAGEARPLLLNGMEVLRRIARAYPPLERDRGTTGVVLLRMRVTAEGRPDPRATYAVGATRRSFARVAVGVARRMRWRPATVDGTPVPTWVEVPVTFDL